MDNGRRVTKLMGTLKPVKCHGDIEVSNVSIVVFNSKEW
jgi:hypothetical protein